MKVAYLTTHILPEDFKILEEKAAIKPNPAGQNFHGRLIKTLSGFADVSVISLVPNREGIIPNCVKESNGIKYTYINAKKSKIHRLLFAPLAIAKAIGDDVDVVIYDSLSIPLAKAAHRCKAKKVAIATDSPYNITGLKPSIADLVVSVSSACDGYFCLTEGLNKLFNKNGAPSLIKMGVAEIEKPAKTNARPPYFYYGGALFVKDGTEALIEAYNALKPDYDLVIAGHGAYEQQVEEAAKNNPRICFLGQISKEENREYEMGASLLINPRLYRKELDEVSIPSKVIEYLGTAAPIVSTKSADLQQAFPDDVNWISDGRLIQEFLEAHLDKNGKLIGLKKNKAAERLSNLLGQEAVGKDFSAFLQTLIQK